MKSSNMSKTTLNYPNLTCQITFDNPESLKIFGGSGTLSPKKITVNPVFKFKATTLILRKVKNSLLCHFVETLIDDSSETLTFGSMTQVPCIKHG